MGSSRERGALSTASKPLPSTEVARQVESSNPRLAPAEAERLLGRVWGITGAVTEIDSTQDQNFRVVRDDGHSFVLKVANACWSKLDLELQNAAMSHVAERDPDLDVQLPVPARDGREIVEERGLRFRTLTWIEGRPMNEVGSLGRESWQALGRLAARTSGSLADLGHPGLHRCLQWDPRQAPATARQLLPKVDPQVRDLADSALEPIRELLARESHLPEQPVHGDVTDYNVVTRSETPATSRPAGLIDFGDVLWTWRVTEVGHAAMSAICHRPADALGVALAVLAGYREEGPLTEEEAEAFWPVLLARAAICALTAAASASAAGSPRSDFRQMPDWLALERAMAIHPALATAAARRACGFEACPAGAQMSRAIEGASPVPIVEIEGPVRALDLSPVSDAFAPGGWRSGTGVAAAIAGEGVGIGRWREVRLHHAGDPGDAPAPTVHLGADVFVPAGTEVRSPLAGTVESVDGSQMAIVCRVGRHRLRVRLAAVRSTVAVGEEVAAGEVVASVAESDGRLPSHVHVQLAAAPGLPGLGDGEYLDLWAELCPDPSSLVGIEVAAEPPPAPGERQARREGSVGRVQALYYKRPPTMVRGWRHLLYDESARPYLDLVNNVAVVGHGHPGIAAAAARQLRLLNTNSRFLYDSFGEYAERLTALLPPSLNSVHLVNSGSEAIELALSIARTVSGRADVIAVEGAYHGWTGGAFELCTNPLDRPDWRDHLSPRVRIVEQPNPYRGQFGDDGPRYAAAVEDACRASRGGIAAFVSEPLLGNQGGVTPAAGYLAAAYESVRRHGGLCIADEVQVSYGRTGSSFWAFEHEGVVPDIVCVAKAAGNGHPLGAVICRRELSDLFARRATFFSTPAGSPVSCAVGIAVLDALRDESLQDNAAAVGAHLRPALEQLAGRHELIGAVHGRGLYLGVELVRDRTSKEPAAPEALAVCERMRELGVVVQPTGDAGNVLKVKPPLCFDRAAAELFVSALDRALGDTERASTPPA